MGYRGKLAEREQARRLRAAGLPMAEIAARLGVSRSSVSLWVRDVPFEPHPRAIGGRRRAPNALQRRKQAEIDRLLAEGRDRLGRLSERELLVAGVALYAGEGSKGDGRLRSALTGIPPTQFLKPYRAVPDPSIRRAKHVHGCVSIGYSCSATHRSIMGLVAALLGGTAIPG
jgi:transcriptional regulator with XRE-family HTH domain